MSSSPLLFILSLPSPLLPLSSHFVFSWFSAWPHLWESNYQMGTPCFNSDLEVNNSITFAGLFCFSAVKLANAPLPYISDIAWGVITVIPHWWRSWRGTHRAVCLGTLCPCSDVKEWWLRRKWHGVGECQPIKFCHSKALFVFQMLCWIAKENVVDISSHRNRRNGIILQRKRITKKLSGSVKCRFH